MGHEWDRDGERCLKCGDKDWFAGPECSADTPPKPRTTAQQIEDEHTNIAACLISEAAVPNATGNKPPTSGN